MTLLLVLLTAVILAVAARAFYEWRTKKSVNILDDIEVPFIPDADSSPTVAELIDGIDVSSLD